MSEMVERVARGMAAAAVGIEPNDDLGRQPTAYEIGIARAAIAAMREPTEAMCKAWWDRCDAGGSPMDDRGDYGGPDWPNGHIVRTWNAMIDEALR